MKAQLSLVGTYAARALGFALVVTALAAPASATISPEMDPGMAMSAMALVSGCMMLIAGRRRK
ncbi:MAG: hypothetical protein KGM43_10205 [Planctomycetota bacterium]|nr:hypothetical protein [Planctomycetota bacterium]